MGQEKRKMAAMAQNGIVIQGQRARQVRVVADLKLENREGVTVLMIGETQPELAIALTPDHCDTLAEALTRHAEANRAVQAETPPDDQPPSDRLIVLPGE